MDGALVVSLLGASGAARDALVAALHAAAASSGRSIVWADGTPLEAASRSRLVLLQQADGPLRDALLHEGLPFAVLSGSVEQQLQSALKALRHALAMPSADDEAAANPRWQWVCERCSDGDCERHLLARP